MATRSSPSGMPPRRRGGQQKQQQQPLRYGHSPSASSSPLKVQASDDRSSSSSTATKPAAASRQQQQQQRGTQSARPTDARIQSYLTALDPTPGSTARPTEAQLRWAQFHKKSKARYTRSVVAALMQSPDSVEDVPGALEDDGNTTEESYYSSSGSDDLDLDDHRDGGGGVPLTPGAGGGRASLSPAGSNHVHQSNNGNTTCIEKKNNRRRTKKKTRKKERGKYPISRGRRAVLRVSARETEERRRDVARRGYRRRVAAASVGDDDVIVDDRGAADDDARGGGRGGSGSGSGSSSGASPYRPAGSPAPMPPAGAGGSNRTKLQAKLESGRSWSRSGGGAGSWSRSGGGAASASTPPPRDAVVEAFGEDFSYAAHSAESPQQQQPQNQPGSVSGSGSGGGTRSHHVRPNQGKHQTASTARFTHDLEECDEERVRRFEQALSALQISSSATTAAAASSSSRAHASPSKRWHRTIPTTDGTAGGGGGGAGATTPSSSSYFDIQRFGSIRHGTVHSPTGGGSGRRGELLDRGASWLVHIPKTGYGSSEKAKKMTMGDAELQDKGASWMSHVPKADMRYSVDKGRLIHSPTNADGDVAESPELQDRGATWTVHVPKADDRFAAERATRAADAARPDGLKVDVSAEETRSPERVLSPGQRKFNDIVEQFQSIEATLRAQRERAAAAAAATKVAAPEMRIRTAQDLEEGRDDGAAGVAATLSPMSQFQAIEARLRSLKGSSEEQSQLQGEEEKDGVVAVLPPTSQFQSIEERLVSANGSSKEEGINSVTTPEGKIRRYHWDGRNSADPMATAVASSGAKAAGVEPPPGTAESYYTDEETNLLKHEGDFDVPDVPSPKYLEYPSPHKYLDNKPAFGGASQATGAEDAEAGALVVYDRQQVDDDGGKDADEPQNRVPAIEYNTADATVPPAAVSNAQDAAAAKASEKDSLVTPSTKGVSVSGIRKIFSFGSSSKKKKKANKQGGLPKDPPEEYSLEPADTTEVARSNNNVDGDADRSYKNNVLEETEVAISMSYFPDEIVRKEDRRPLDDISSEERMNAMKDTILRSQMDTRQAIIDTDGTTSDVSGTDDEYAKLRLGNLMLSPTIITKRYQQAVSAIEVRNWEQVIYLLSANPWLAEMTDVRNDQYLLHKLALYGAGENQESNGGDGESDNETARSATAAPDELTLELIDRCPAAVHKFDHEGNLPLHMAATSGNLKMIKQAGERFPSGASVRNNEGMLPLHLGVLSCAYPSGAGGSSSPSGVVKSILDLFPGGIGVTDNDGNLPLHIAAANLSGDLGVDIIYLLLDEGEKQTSTLRLPADTRVGMKSKPNEPEDDDDMGTDITATNTDASSTDEAGGVTPFCNLVKNGKGNTPITEAIQTLAGWQIIEILIQGGGGREAALKADESSRNALHLLISGEYADPASVLSLLKIMPNIAGIPDGDGVLPIEMACISSMPRAVILALVLVDLPVDLDDKDAVKVREGYGASWCFLTCDCDDAHIEIVDEVISICSYRQTRELCFMRSGPTRSGGTVISRATPKSKLALRKALRFVGRYEFVGSSPVHSEASEGLKVFDALDFGTDSEPIEKGRAILLKCYSKEEPYMNEISKLNGIQFDHHFVEHVDYFCVHDFEAYSSANSPQQYCVAVEKPSLTLARVVAGSGDYRKDPERFHKYLTRVGMVLRLIGKSIRHLHSLGMIHGNIALQNCGKFDAKWKLMGITGARFGDEEISSRQLGDCVPPEAATLSPNESGGLDNASVSLCETLKASPSLDAWAFGKLMYEVLVGDPLIPFDYKMEAFYNDQNALIALAAWDESTLRDVVSEVVESGAGTLAADLISHCLCPKPEDRPRSFEEVLAHPFWRDTKRKLKPPSSGKEQSKPRQRALV